MICPNCKNTIPDGSSFCNHCGYNLAGQDLQIKSPQQISAEKQLSSINIESPKIGIAVGAVISAISVLSETTIGFIVGLIVIIISAAILISTKDKSNNLQRIANSDRLICLCPSCKSSNIQMNLVQTGTTSVHGKTLVSQNINPLRPFTHTNVRQGNTYTAASYSNKCICLNCGYVFDKPEKFYT